MSISIIFDTTGDSITFVDVNPDIAEYYVDHLNQTNSNSFKSISTHPGVLIRNYAEKLRNLIVQLNSVIYKFNNKKFVLPEIENCLSQSILNQLHEQWALFLHEKYDIRQHQTGHDIDTVDTANKLFHLYPDEEPTPFISDILGKLNLLDHYGTLNKDIHDLESLLFKPMTFDAHRTINIVNNFPKSRITNDQFNLRIAFNHLGRTLYNKYETFDNGLIYQDENNYDQLLSQVEVILQKPQKIDLSNEYIAWCDKLGKKPSGQYLNIGQLGDIDQKLDQYRLIFYRNLLSGNNFSLIIR